MKIGIWQTNTLYRFLIQNFNTESYKCGSNGLVSYIKGVNDSGFGYTVEIEFREWATNIVRISYDDFEYTATYTTVHEFKDIMENVEL